MGVSGTSVFCQLIDRLINSNGSEAHCIYLYEKNRGNLGVGLPYSTVTPKVWLLNGDSTNFKLLPGSESLRTWLEQNKSEWSPGYPVIDMTYPPRSLVGLYTKNLYDKFKKKAKNYGISIEEHFEEVSDIQKGANNLWHLSTLGQETEIRVDVVFFCIGHLSSDNFLPLRDKPNYLHQPLDIHRLNSIPKNEEIFVIGSQSTFIDVAKYLFLEAEFLGKINTISRNKNIITLNESITSINKNTLNKFVADLCKLPPCSLTLKRGLPYLIKCTKKL